METRRPIEAVAGDAAPRLLAIPGVAIVYAGARDDGSPCVVIGVAAMTSELRRALPKEVEGYPVEVRETGPIAPR